MGLSRAEKPRILRLVPHGGDVGAESRSRRDRRASSRRLARQSLDAGHQRRQDFLALRLTDRTRAERRRNEIADLAPARTPRGWQKRQIVAGSGGGDRDRIGDGASSADEAPQRLAIPGRARAATKAVPCAVVSSRRSAHLASAIASLLTSMSARQSPAAARKASANRIASVARRTDGGGVRRASRRATAASTMSPASTAHSRPCE